jgi:pyridoxine/pyridoxamine 5'-phosphate oxidase
VDQVTGLHAALDQAFALLAEGVADPASPWHTPSLATTGAGAPGLRTVVLRRFMQAERQVEFHTDARSPKLAAIQANPDVSLHVWDKRSRVQLRLSGRASMLGTAESAAIWKSLPPQTQATYSVALAPGTPISAPEEARHSLDHAASQAVFCAVRIAFHELEWLHLAHGQHRRARFTWANGACVATWLAP